MEREMNSSVWGFSVSRRERWGQLYQRQNEERGNAHMHISSTTPFWNEGLIGWWVQIDWRMRSATLQAEPLQSSSLSSNQRHLPHAPYPGQFFLYCSPPPVLQCLPEETEMDRWAKSTVSVRFCSAARSSRERQTYIPLMPVLNGLSASPSPPRGAFLSQGQHFIISLLPEIEN